MKQLFFILILSLSFFKTLAQVVIDQCMVRFACDTCAFNHNPLVYSGGNIISADMVSSSDGNYLRLMSGSTIDTNAIPTYFDIYSLVYWGSTNSQNQCSSFRSLNFTIDFSSGGLYELRLISNVNAGYRVWLASSSGQPGPGESTFQTDPLNSASQVILAGESQTNNVYGNTFSLSSSTPVWKDWAGKSSINMYGFTALTPNTEYRIYEVWIAYKIPAKLASYDCGLPGAVKDETLKAKSKIYPLPASDVINIELPGVNQKYQVQIMSGSGKIIYQDYHFGNTSIPLSDFIKGLYLMKISVEESYFIQKIIKE